MKKIILILFLFASFISAQDETNLKPFSTFGIGFYGGVNFENTDDIYNAFYVEAGTNLFGNLMANLSFGYFQFIEGDDYLIKTNGFVRIEKEEWWNSFQYNVNSIEYQIIPLSIGLKYFTMWKGINPYLLLSASLNLIDPFPNKGQYTNITRYATQDEIPAEFRQIHQLVNESIGFNIGGGIKYSVYKKLKLDLRYLYRSDSEIQNTHQILLGIGI